MANTDFISKQWAILFIPPALLLLITGGIAAVFSQPAVLTGLGIASVTLGIGFPIWGLVAIIGLVLSVALFIGLFLFFKPKHEYTPLKSSSSEIDLTLQETTKITETNDANKKVELTTAFNSDITKLTDEKKSLSIDESLGVTKGSESKDDRSSTLSVLDNYARIHDAIEQSINDKNPQALKQELEKLLKLHENINPQVYPEADEVFITFIAFDLPGIIRDLQPSEFNPECFKAILNMIYEISTPIDPSKDKTAFNNLKLDTDINQYTCGKDETTLIDYFADQIIIDCQEKYNPDMKGTRTHTIAAFFNEKGFYVDDFNALVAALKERQSVAQECNSWNRILRTIIPEWMGTYKLHEPRPVANTDTVENPKSKKQISPSNSSSSLFATGGGDSTSSSTVVSTPMTKEKFYNKLNNIIGTMYDELKSSDLNKFKTSSRQKFIELLNSINDANRLAQVHRFFAESGFIPSLFVEYAPPNYPNRLPELLELCKQIASPAIEGADTNRLWNLKLDYEVADNSSGVKPGIQPMITVCAQILFKIECIKDDCSARREKLRSSLLEFVSKYIRPQEDIDNFMEEFERVAAAKSFDLENKEDIKQKLFELTTEKHGDAEVPGAGEELIPQKIATSQMNLTAV